MPVKFYNQDIKFKLSEKNRIKKWVKTIVKEHKKELGDINYILCSDSYLIEINKKFLNHDYFTDIITFNYNFDEFIEGDIFISIDTVNFNSKKYKTNPQEELLRVIIHGILHLLGFNDKSKEEKLKMRDLENWALKLYHEDESRL